MFWTSCLATLLVCLWRRYRPPKYSTQKLSRSSELIERAPIEVLKVPWTVKHMSYAPLGTIDDSCPLWWFYPTIIDGRTRLLIEVSPFTMRSVPSNPFGRTGAVGKGRLKQYGPNHMSLTVFWSRPGGVHKVCAVKSGLPLYRGYVDHPLNTDNAWVEADIHHVEVHDCFGARESCEEWLQVILRRFRLIDGVEQGH